MTASDAVTWLQELRSKATTLRSDSQSRLYWSQKQDRSSSDGRLTDLQPTVRRCRAAIAELESQHWFARTLGYDCVDGDVYSDVTLAELLDQRVGKPHLCDDGIRGSDVPTDNVLGRGGVGLAAFGVPEWSEDDLCDFVEVMHDIAARPIRESFHDFGECGWHPVEYDRASGKALYRWRLNQVFASSTLGLKLADEGEDIGRIVRVLPGGLDELVTEVVAAEDNASVAHAVRLFRAHDAAREDRRSAVRELAFVLEEHRTLIKQNLLSKDEGDLFKIANMFAIRHNNANQQDDYADDYLDWLFHWYLATVELTRRLSQR